MNKATEMLVKMISNMGNNPSATQLATLRWVAEQVKKNEGR